MNRVALALTILALLFFPSVGSAQHQDLPGPTVAPARVATDAQLIPPRLPELSPLATAAPLDPVPTLDRSGGVARHKRPWWLFPAIGAVTVDAWVLYRYSTNKDEISYGLTPFLIAGAGVGALAGGFVELVARGPAPKRAPPPQ